jgi:MATE family, multidrug efflux pump
MNYHVKLAPHEPFNPVATPKPQPRLDDRTKMLLEQPLVSTIARLAIPNTAVMVVQVLIGLLEVYFIARLGVDALAGAAQVFPFVALVLAISQGATGGGIVTSIARALGKGDGTEANNYAWYAVALAVPLGLITTAVMWLFGPLIYRQMGAHGAALSIALAYSTTIFAGATLIWTFNLLMAAVRGTGNLIFPVLVVCGGAALLIPLSLILIFGALGIPGLGAAGGAVAMLVYYGLGSLAYAAYLWGHFGVLKPSQRPPRLSLGPALSVLRIGGMSAVVAGSTNLTIAIVTGYVGLHGIEALAGYGAGSRLELLLVPVAYGVGGPVGILVSANLGAGRADRAIRASWVGVLLGSGVTEMIGLAAALFPERWIGLFSQDPWVMAAGVDYLHRVGPFFGFFGLGFVLYCIGQATRQLTAPVVGALARSAIAVLGGYALLRCDADLSWNFIAVGVGMSAFGLISLLGLLRRAGY